MTTEEKPLELLTLVTAFVRQKYPKKKKNYGVIICDKHPSIVNIKEGIIYDDRRKTVGTINTCDGFCASKIPQKKIYGACYYLRQTFFHHKYKRGYYL